MIEVTKDSIVGKELSEKKFYAIKNEKGQYYIGTFRYFSTDISRSIVKNRQDTITKEAQSIMRFWDSDMAGKVKPFEKLYVVELKFVEAEE